MMVVITTPSTAVGMVRAVAPLVGWGSLLLVVELVASLAFAAVMASPAP